MPRDTFSFSAGPAMLPESILEQLAVSIVDHEGTGLSVAEISHRASEYKDEIFPATIDLFRELLNVPENYKILFIAGGASFEFGNIVRNLMRRQDSAQYVDTGHWSKKAHDTAKIFQNDGLVKRIEKIEGLEKINGLTNLRDIPHEEINEHSAFIHICANETIDGLQYPSFPYTGEVPLVADMSSELFTRKFDMNGFGAIYACGQKNFGFAGFSVVIVREDLIGKVLPGTIDVQNYKIVADNDSALNTPPTAAIYTANLIVNYIKEQGRIGGGDGVKRLANLADYKSGLIYKVIDESDGFYKSPVHPDARSKLNIPFLLPNEDLEKDFKKLAASEGLLTLGGHRSVGGLRASLYIGMPIEGAQRLARFMEDFGQTYRASITPSPKPT